MTAVLCAPAQLLRAKGLRHPSAGLHLPAGACFVPNDVQLGGGSPAFIILTGPNMGGARANLEHYSTQPRLPQMMSLRTL